MRIEKKQVSGKTWGYEQVLVNNTLYSAKILTVLQNKSCCIRFHKKSMKSFYILEGSIVLEIYEDMDLSKCKTFLITTGDCVTVENKTPYKFYGIEPVNKVLQVSSRDDPKDVFQMRPV